MTNVWVSYRFIDFNRDIYCSQKLGDDTEMSLLQVLEAWELLIKVLSQVEDFLRNVKNLILTHSAYLDQSCHNLSIDQVFLLKLLTDFQGNINCSNSKEAWVSGGEFQIMHGHLGQIDCHFFNKILLNLEWIHHLGSIFLNLVFRLRIRSQSALFLLFSLSSVHDFNSKNLDKVHLQEV